VVLSDLLAGDHIPTFVSHQLYYGKRVPVKFLNLSELKKMMESLQYRLFLKTFFQTDILGRAELPMGALPERQRLKKTLNCVFTR
jgi:hypothetical protein